MPESGIEVSVGVVERLIAEVASSDSMLLFLKFFRELASQTENADRIPVGSGAAQAEITLVWAAGRKDGFQAKGIRSSQAKGIPGNPAWLFQLSEQLSAAQFLEQPEVVWAISFFHGRLHGKQPDPVPDSTPF